MTDLVPADRIEQIVGALRHDLIHIGRAVTGDQAVYILHSSECRDSGIDLRACQFSIALDRGIAASDWSGHEDRPVLLGVHQKRLMPFEDLDTAGYLDVQLIPSGGDS